MASNLAEWILAASGFQFWFHRCRFFCSFLVLFPTFLRNITGIEGPFCRNATPPYHGNKTLWRGYGLISLGWGWHWVPLDFHENIVGVAVYVDLLCRSPELWKAWRRTFSGWAEFAESLEMSSVKGLKWMDFVTVTYGNPINYRFGGILLPTKASEPIILWRFLSLAWKGQNHWTENSTSLHFWYWEIGTSLLDPATSATCQAFWEVWIPCPRRTTQHSHDGDAREMKQQTVSALFVVCDRPRLKETRKFKCF